MRGEFKKQVSNESGASMVEASIVMILLVPTIIMSMYFFILTHRINSAHFKLQNTLRRFSVGPEARGTTPQVFSDDFRERLFSELDSVGVRFPNNNNLKLILLRNDVSCYYLTRSSYQPVNQQERDCLPAIPGQAPLTPNNFITIEIDVGVFQNANLDVFNSKGLFRMPTPRIVSGMRMGSY